MFFSKNFDQIDDLEPFDLENETTKIENIKVSYNIKIIDCSSQLNPRIKSIIRKDLTMEESKK